MDFQPLWVIAARQHWVLAGRQLRLHGLTKSHIRARLAAGRLFRVAHDVYVVGRRELTREGQWMVAVLGCGEGAVLSHLDAAWLWGFGKPWHGVTHVSVPRGERHPRRDGVRLHRREPGLLGTHARRHMEIPVTSPLLTLIDVAGLVDEMALERMVNEADVLGLCTPDQLRLELGRHRGRRGLAKLRRILDRRSFVMTRTELEQRFAPIARRAGLSKPRTQRKLHGYVVDFFFEDIGLIVETDGLTYHRTPYAQARDQLRDQTHIAAGLTVLRFTHHQVRYEPRYVEETLRSVAAHLSSVRSGSS